MFRVLERPSFSLVQSHLFPIYFSLQTALPAVLALTYPGSNNPLGVASGIAGILDESKRYCTLLPIATMFVSGALNLFVLLPATKKVMAERQNQGRLLFIFYFFPFSSREGRQYQMASLTLRALQRRRMARRVTTRRRIPRRCRR